MEALIAFGIVITLALGAVRLGTLALQRTGLSRESASFQAQSAFMGVGFTTSESETVVNHPVRRRILRMLMWGGYSGITVTVSTIVSGVGSSDGHLLRFLGLMLVTAGVLLSVWQITSVRELADRLLTVVVARIPHLEVIDFEELLEFDKGYTVAQLHVDRNRWMTGRTLRDLRLADEGVLVLSVTRASGATIGTPEADTTLEVGDRILIYGHQESLERLRSRTADSRGEVERQESVLVQRERMAAELADAERLASEPESAAVARAKATPEDRTEAPGGPPSPLT